MRPHGNDFRRHGTVLLMVIFVAALLAVLVIGMLQLNVDDVQITRNQIGAAKALAVAEAGLDDAIAVLRSNPDWQTGFSAKPFSGGGDYTVVVDDSRVKSTGRSADGFTATIAADVIISTSGPSHRVVTKNLRVNE